jgi:hypothetical protein
VGGPGNDHGPPRLGTVRQANETLPNTVTWRRRVDCSVGRSLSRGYDRRRRVFIWKPFFGTNTVRGWKDDLGLFSKQRPKSNAVKVSKLPNAAPARPVACRENLPSCFTRPKHIYRHCEAGAALPGDWRLRRAISAQARSRGTRASARAHHRNRRDAPARRAGDAGAAYDRQRQLGPIRKRRIAREPERLGTAEQAPAPIDGGPRGGRKRDGRRDQARGLTPDPLRLVRFGQCHGWFR